MYCLKSVRMGSYSGPHSPAFGLNTKRYGVSLRIQSEFGKTRTRITPNMYTFKRSDDEITPMFFIPHGC